MISWVLLASALYCAGAPLPQSTTALLDAGRALKGQMRGQAPFRREAARMGAVRAFRACSKETLEPGERALCALRAGELLCAASLDEPGLKALIEGAQSAPSTWSHRSRLAAGEALITQGRYAEASRFLEAIKGAGVPSCLSEAARVLRGVSLKGRGEDDAAARLWREVAEGGLTPRARIDAFELWGRELLSSGDVEGAAGVLHLCREKMSAAAFEATAQGRYVRARLRRSTLANSIRRAMCSRSK